MFHDSLQQEHYCYERLKLKILGNLGNKAIIEEKIL